MEEMIVMVRLGERAFIPVHVLARDQKEAHEMAIGVLLDLGLEVPLQSVTITTFPQIDTNLHYRGLWRVL